MSCRLGAKASIVCTQPRRLAAIGVAERVAAERAERCGETVGYSIRLESKRSSSTRLLFCTTGILLRTLEGDGDLLDFADGAGVSHVLVDEVHERNAEIDFLLIILKDLLIRRPGLKLVRFVVAILFKCTDWSDLQKPRVVSTATRLPCPALPCTHTHTHKLTVFVC